MDLEFVPDVQFDSGKGINPIVFAEFVSFGRDPVVERAGKVIAIIELGWRLGGVFVPFIVRIIGSPSSFDGLTPAFGGGFDVVKVALTPFSEIDGNGISIPIGSDAVVLPHPEEGDGLGDVDIGDIDLPIVIADSLVLVVAETDLLHRRPVIGFLVVAKFGVGQGIGGAPPGGVAEIDGRRLGIGGDVILVDPFGEQGPVGRDGFRPIELGLQFLLGVPAGEGESVLRRISRFSGDGSGLDDEVGHFRSPIGLELDDLLPGQIDRIAGHGDVRRSQRFLRRRFSRIRRGVGVNRAAAKQ